MKTCMLIGFGIACATVARANVWDDGAARYGGRVDGAATGAFETGSLLDTRHGANTSGPTMANVKDWHANKGGRSMTFRTENVTLNTRATTYVSDSVVSPTILQNATVLHFDHPEVTNADESVTCKRSSLYFPLCTIWGSPTAVTYLMRFRIDKEQFLKTDGAWDYCNILSSDWEYNGSGGNGFKIWVKPTGTDDQIYFCHGNRMDGEYIKTGLHLTNTVWPERSEVWAELAVVVKDAKTVRIGLALPGAPMQWCDKACSGISSLLPRENWGIMVGGDGASADTASSHLECTRMSMHLFAAWPRALSDREVYEAFSDTGMAVMRVGCAGASTEAFAGDGTADVTFDSASADWRSLPKVLPTGRSVSVTFTPETASANLPQLARVTAAATSASGKVQVLVDGTAVGEAAVRAGETASVFVPGALLGGGAHTLTFKSMEGNLALDTYELLGSRGFGQHGKHWRDKTSTSVDFYTENGNLKNLSYGPGQNLILTLPADVAAKNRYSYTTYLAEAGGLTWAKLTVNGKEKFFSESPKIGDNYPVTVTFAPGELQAGENVFKWTIGAGWLIFDDHIFTVGKEPSGMMLLLR